MVVKRGRYEEIDVLVPDLNVTSSGLCLCVCLIFDRRVSVYTAAKASYLNE